MPAVRSWPRIEARFGDLADRRVAVLCGRGSNGGDGFVAAGAPAPRAWTCRSYLIGRVAEIRGDARVNSRSWAVSGRAVTEIADAAVLGPARPGSPLVRSRRRRHLRHGPQGSVERSGRDGGRHRQRIGDPRGVRRPAVRALRGLAEPIGRCIRAALTVTLAAPKLPLVLPPAVHEAGAIVVADIGIPRRVIEEVEGPRVELLDAARRCARWCGRGRRRRTRALRTRPRCRRFARKERRGAPGGGRSPPLGCRAGDHRDTEERSARRGDDGAGVHDRRARRDGRRASLAAGAIERVLEIACRCRSPLGPGLGGRPETTAFVRALLERATVPLVLDADGAQRVRGRSGLACAGRERRGDHHAAPGRDGAPDAACRPTRCRRAGSKCPRLRRRARRARRPQGTSDARRDAGREGLHQPDRQSGHGHRRRPATC